MVHVTYDDEQIDYETLFANAKRMECTSAVYTHDENQKKIATAGGAKEVIEWKDSLETRQVKKSEQKYYLRNSVYSYLPLTELQAVKLNVAVSPKSVKKLELDSILSDRQMQLLERIQDALDQDENALQGFSFPEDQSNLISYSKKLHARIAELEKANRK